MGREEDESVASKTFTALLGLGLLAAMGFAAYTFTMPSGNASARSSRASAIDELEATPSAPAAEPPQSPTEPAAQAALADQPAQDEPEKAEAPPLRKRPRTVGKKVVDPRLIEARKSVKVTMYSAPWCFICDRARSFLEAREVSLTEHDVDMDPEAEKRLEQLNPAGSIPTFVVDGKTIVGFHPWGLEDSIDAAAQEHFCAQSSQGAVCERLASAR